MNADINTQIAALDWPHIATDLDARGYAVIPRLLSAAACQDLAALYTENTQFRSHIVMKKYGFGSGEYKYFSYPLPDPIQALRSAFYPHLVPIANRWHAQLGLPTFPSEHIALLALCHAAMQVRPTPLLLRYVAGDYNCLHQDLYGEHYFPLQVAILLNEAGQDFSGGEFVLTEQKPRMQSRAEVVPFAQGDALIFPTRYRPVAGLQRSYRVNTRHGVSTVHSGLRHTLGIIFHDAS